MYYTKSQIDKGRRIADYLILIANILSILNFVLSLVIENKFSIKGTEYEIIIEILLIITTFFYYRGSSIAFRLMRYIMNITVLTLILIPILFLNGMLIKAGLIDFGVGVLALVISMVLIIIAVILLFKSRLFNDYLAYIDYRKHNSRRR